MFFILADTITGWSNPTTTGENNNDFTNPTNAYASDDSDATEATVGQKQDYGDFGFNIGAGDTIRGIEVKVEADLSSSGHWHVGVEVSNDNGATWSTQKLIQYQSPSGDIVKVAGHGRSLWGLTWTAGDLNDENFRVRIEYQAKESGSARTLQIDHVSVKVSLKIVADAAAAKGVSSSVIDL